MCHNRRDLITPSFTKNLIWGFEPDTIKFGGLLNMSYVDIRGPIYKQLSKHTSSQERFITYSGLSEQHTIVTGNGIYLMRPWLSLNT